MNIKYISNREAEMYFSLFANIIIAKAIDKANAIIEIATSAIVSKIIIDNIHSNISTTSFM